MPEQTEPKEQSASDVLLAAMSRSDIYSPQFLAFLNRQGASPETIHNLTYSAMRFLATALTNTVQWPEGWQFNDDQIAAIQKNFYPEDVFTSSQLNDWAIENGYEHTT